VRCRVTPEQQEGRPRANENRPTATASYQRPQYTAASGGPALRGVDIADAHTDDWWRSCCDAGIEHLASTGVVFQAADLIDLGVPSPDSPKRWGARVQAAVRAGLIEPAGYAPSKRRTCAGSIVHLWKGVSR
jgi:hypothetical protein